MEIKKPLQLSVIFGLLMASAGFVFAASEPLPTEYVASGNQNRAYLTDAIPLGDTLFRAAKFLTDLNAEFSNMIDSSEDYVYKVRELLRISQSCSESNCQAQCEPDCPINAAGPQDCTCKPIAPNPNAMCGSPKSTETYQRIVSAYQSATGGTQNYLNLIEKPFAPTDDIRYVTGLDLKTVVIGSKSIDSYSSFYQNYNQIFRGKINTSLPVILPPNYVVEMEYIKKKLDLSRLGFLRCNTPTEKEEDVVAIGEGEVEYKGPLRIDFILQNNGTLPDKPTNYLDYFCYSYENI